MKEAVYFVHTLKGVVYFVYTLKEVVYFANTLKEAVYFVYTLKEAVYFVYTLKGTVYFAYMLQVTNVYIMTFFVIHLEKTYCLAERMLYFSEESTHLSTNQDSCFAGRVTNISFQKQL